ncbi:MAG TPA: hypothetical protein VNB22_16665 [Pyrinomonadaceae bacterium]|nr:hypothetical protein [Pyrinomonadaceae bacterium]
MIGVKIKDKNQSKGGGSSLSFSLKDILALVGEKVLTSRWRCSDLNYVKNIKGEWYPNKDKTLKLSGAELIDFSERVGLILDGRFEAKSEGGAKRPWLLIVAFDTSWYEVWSSKPWVIEKIKAHFKDVSDITAK